MQRIGSEGERRRSLSAVLLAVAIVVGTVAPGLVSALKPWALPALFFLVVFSLTLLEDRPEQVLGKIDILSVKIVIWQLFAVPLIVVVFAFATSMPAEVRTILLISATASSVFASPAIVHIVGLDTTLATRSMVLSTILMPFSLFAFGVVAGALPLSLSISDYLLRVVVFMLVPIMLASGWRRMSENLAPTSQSRLSVFSYWGSIFALIVFGIGVQEPVHEVISVDMARVLSYAGVAVLFGIVVFGMSVTLFIRAGANRSITAGMLGAVRNVGLSYAILGTAVGAEAALYIAVCQFPIFFMPLILRLWGNLALVLRGKSAA